MRVVDKRLRDLDALAHALRVGGQAPRVGRVELDDGERAGGSGVGILDLVQYTREAYEFEGGEALEDPFLLRHDADLAGQLEIAPGIAVEDAHASLGWRGQPGQHPQQRGLAGAVRPE